ncbi:hypothetical protein L596_001456 [Steinernema carpocapsae]|uniref:Uncharacterized protein n=1 Tax=Steinernema carpocapsae TaxID=34508 RepID=A0A4U8UNV6_STECR|nr:hypothetical protein L596_001456 [Steinernema carpocapsae]
MTEFNKFFRERTPARLFFVRVLVVGEGGFKGVTLLRMYAYTFLSHFLIPVTAKAGRNASWKCITAV